MDEQACFDFIKSVVRFGQTHSEADLVAAKCAFVKVFSGDELENVPSPPVSVSAGDECSDLPS